MHIDPTTHEHHASSKVYTYEADYDVAADAITWEAVVTHADIAQRRFRGTVPVSSPGVALLAEEAVRDAIVKRIDTFDDQQQDDGGATAPAG